MCGLLQGIWIANYQALPANKEPIDLTAPGAYYTGRKIFLPTCGHRGTLLGAQPVGWSVGCVLSTNWHTADHVLNPVAI